METEDSFPIEDLQCDFNKIVLHPGFRGTIEEIGKMNVSLPEFFDRTRLNYSDFIFPQNAELVTPLSEISRVSLDAEAGSGAVHNGLTIIAYDESVNRFDSLEGVAYCTSHSLVLLGKEAYVPANYLTFYFYTRSNEIVDESQYIKRSNNPEMDSQRDYMRDKILFIQSTVPPRTVLLIDGPLIAGDVYTYMIPTIESFIERKVVPIFFVKNSSSNMVTDNIPEMKNRYNSDLHWSFNYLKAGERTNYFRYVDRHNPKNAKVFCYLKAFDLSPQRVEMHTSTYSEFEQSVDRMMDMIYYLILVQGSKSNPQVRPIAIAEMYARETLKLVDVRRIMKEAGIVPTMNQERFGW